MKSPISTTAVPHRASFLSAALVVLVVAGVVAVGVYLALEGDGAPTASAALGGRSEIVTAMPVGEDGGAARKLALIHADGGDLRYVGTSDTYSAVAFSPDGQVVAALAAPTGPGEDARLHLVDTDTGTEQVVALPAASAFPAWSPDGAYIAVAGAEPVLLNRGGKQLAAADVPGVVDGKNFSEHYGGGFAWSHDSSQFGLIVNDRVILMSPSGGVAMTDLSEAAGSPVSAGVVLGWMDGALIVTAGGDTAYAVRGSGDAITVDPLPAGAQRPEPQDASAPSSQLVSAAGEAVPDGEIWRSRQSADGLADVAEVRNTRDAAAAPVLIIHDRSSGAVYTANRLPLDLRGGQLYDVHVGSQ